jgi:hypothetical protein
VNRPSCRVCRVDLEEGFLADRGHGNNMSEAKWVEGAPEHRIWLGIDCGVKTDGHALRKISVWRCPRCGLLEHYAL